MDTKIIFGLSILLVIYNAIGIAYTAPGFYYPEPFDNYDDNRNSAPGIYYKVVYPFQPETKDIYEDSKRFRLVKSGKERFKSLAEKRGIKTGLVDVLDYLHYKDDDSGQSSRLFPLKRPADSDSQNRR